ncbi:MAG: DUF4258 domain-containing protein [Candidatus Portnoybacteria bacterium]|nr:DUF4258 domain-containing protein [Candidatus Portnoybacteria bacterium]
MKIQFSKHALESMKKRGASRAEVKEAILKGTWEQAKQGRVESIRNFSYNREWNGVFYEKKQVNPVFIKEDEVITVITVYAFYFNS